MKLVAFTAEHPGGAWTIGQARPESTTAAARPGRGAATTGASAGVPTAAAVLARAHGENFPVAARLLPRHIRRQLLAVYGFARLVDDLGDQAPGDRRTLLDWLETELDRLFAGSRPQHPLLRDLACTVRQLELPRQPFDALIAANRQDQNIRRYPTYADLLAYCKLSANPVGRLVLHVFGVATPERVRLSDCICSALQLLEHWQDLAEDAARDRIYVPLTDLQRFGCRPADLRSGPTLSHVRQLVAFEVARTRDLLETGAPLVATLCGWARVAVAGYVAGGRVTLHALARSGYDVLRSPAQPRAGRVAVATLRSLATGQ